MLSECTSRKNTRRSVALLCGAALLTAGGLEAAGVPDDWSSSHVVFSSPGPGTEAAKRFGSLEAWLKLLNSTRWQWQKKLRSGKPGRGGNQSSTKNTKRDWSYYLGPTAGAAVSPAMFPAKYSFDVNATPDCLNDFVVFALNKSGSSGAATVTGTFSSDPSSGTVTITNGTSITLTATPAVATGMITLNGVAAGATVTIGTTTYTFVTRAATRAYDVVIANRSNSNTARNLQAAINANSSQCSSSSCYGSGTTANSSVTATRNNNQVTVTAISAGMSGSSIAFRSTGNGIALSNASGHLQGGAGANSGLNFQVGDGTDSTAANLAAAISRNGAAVGVTATSDGDTVTVTAVTPGTAGNSITLSGSMQGFSWANGGRFAGGGEGQPTIVAFNNLYSGPQGGYCNANAPKVYWAYNTGGPILTSPALSADGTKVAFVEAGAPAVLHILKWKAGEGLNGSGKYTPLPPTNTAISSWAECPAAQSCMIDVPFSDTGAADTRSSPYYDFDNDAIYVGDDSGYLSKITGAFKGAPRREFTLQVSTGALTGAVLDFSSRNVFVADALGQLHYIRDTGSRTGTCASGTTPPCVGSTSVDVSGGSGRPVIDPPMVDCGTGRVFVFNSGGTDGGTPHRPALVTQTDTTLGDVVSVAVGDGSGDNDIHVGAFDNSYYTNTSTGHLYVCGNPDFTQTATLYRIGFDANGKLNPARTNESLALGHASGAAGQECSPITEVYNNGKDWLFVGLTENCGSTGTSGCILSFDITDPSKFPTGSYARANEAGGTSGIIVDNVSQEAEASSIYYTTQGGGTCSTVSGGTQTGCAVKRTQSGLN